jgi:flagellar hook-associated protein 2
LAQQASVTGTQAIAALTGDETLTITSGSTSAAVSLLQNDSLSTVLSKINAALSAQGMAVTATDDGTGKLKISTNDFGSSQNLTVVSSGYGSSGTTGFGLSPVASTGVDIVGKINGNDAVGNGLILTGAAGQPEEGLSLRISQTTTGNYGSATVASDTEGTEGSSVLMNLFSALDGLTDPLSGPIQSATDGLNRNITALKKNISSYQQRLEIRREMLTQEYNQADQALRLMSVTQSQLSSQIASLSS